MVLRKQITNMKWLGEKLSKYNPLERNKILNGILFIHFLINFTYLIEVHNFQLTNIN